MTKFLIVLLISQTINAAPFTMLCRGGGSMALWLKPDGQVRLDILGDHKVMHRTKGELIFKRAKVGYSDKLPPMGHYAWTHRGLSREESGPIHMEFSGIYQAVIGSKGDAVLSRIDDSGSLKTDHQIEFFRKKIKDGSYFKMDVSFDGNRLKLEKMYF